MSIKKYWLSALFFLFMVSTDSEANSCAGLSQPNPSIFNRSDYVFKGRMIHEYHDVVNGWINYQFTIENIWKGDANENQITITDVYGNYDFPVYFIRNDEYIVYANNTGSRIASSSCSSDSVNSLNYDANFLKTNAPDDIHLPTHEKALDSLLFQISSNSDKINKDITAKILKIKNVQFKYKNRIFHAVLFNLNKGLKDGIYIGDVMYFYQSDYFVHSMIINKLNDANSNAIYFCERNNEYCNSVDISILKVGDEVYTNPTETRHKHN